MKFLPLIIIKFSLICLAVSQAIAGTLNSLTLPERETCQGLYYPDIQASFPDTDFTALERLYIPAGHYKFIRIGNLPQANAQRPLVITNLNGQVRVGGCGHYYNFILGGGSHWKLTGEYDPSLATGHVNYQGHKNGQYANSADTYGFLIDAEFGSGHIGLAVGGGATDFEVSFVESRHLEFAGMMFKTDDDGEAHMNNVKIHDNYIHDTISEGVYIGSTQSQPQHKFNNLQFYNNRLIRTGTEIGQFGNLGDNSRIHHNVFLLGALDWKNPFQIYQDGGIQLGHREGSMSFDHNIVIGGASNYMIVFNNDVEGDQHNPEDVLDIHNNYFSYSRDTGVYIHSASDGIKTVQFRDNHFSKVVFSYDELEPGDTGGNHIIFSANNNNPISIINNIFDTQDNQNYFAGGSNISSSGNSTEQIDDITFNALGWPGEADYFRMEIWTDLDRHDQPVSYQQGDLVLHNGIMYQAMANIDYTVNDRETPDNDSQSLWQKMPQMSDDVRQSNLSPFSHIGLLDQVITDLVFSNGFE